MGIASQLEPRALAGCPAVILIFMEDTKMFFSIPCARPRVFGTLHVQCLEVFSVYKGVCHRRRPAAALGRSSSRARWLLAGNFCRRRATTCAECVCRWIFNEKSWIFRISHGFWEIWVSKLTTPPRCVQAYSQGKAWADVQHRYSLIQERDSVNSTTES